ncbi:GNAT family N-acetyltransferase [Saccharibacillus alkalitolerans]|uniref:GNAT family N-acetyltransferase n=1 Tax=Saccharibacillus alkalitolerans TaxID=2705290 RepID=A0ABX0FAD8_9BACL|nr:GNAT family N-acetyltransferase [Saccharibacillus alkalitolerans]NGZ77896.1 GNAT family N-acetyltransferase [Saccharibacillus alkalitolerans]
MIDRVDMEDDLLVHRLLQLQTTAYRLEAKLIGFDEIPPLADTFETLKRSSDTFYGYTAKSGELAGAVAVEEEMPGELTLTRMMVHPDFFRQGIASRLIEYVFAHYPDFSVYIVSTGSRNRPAMRLYEKFGFVPFKRENIAPGIELATMRREREAKRPE